jgi:autotransporter-associated beta strand protein
MTVSGDISGTGNVQIACNWGAGTVMLSGSNSYTGGTMLFAGTLQLGSATALGNTAGSLNFYGDCTLDLNGYNLSVNALGDGYSGTVTNSNSTLSTFTVNSIIWDNTSGSIVGNLAFVVAGSGGDLSGGTTIDAGATLWCGHGGIPSTLEGNVVDNGTLEFGSSGTATVTANISGTGNIVIQTDWGAGTVVLIGNDSSFTGVTTIAAGTLQLGNGTTGGSLGGSIVDNAILTFDLPAAATIDNTISGNSSATIENIGSGEITLAALDAYYGSLGSGIDT